jgi:Rrf2 family protein
VLSQTAEYALRAVLTLATEPSGQMDAARLAAQLGVPRNYLSKTLHQLARAGILQSSRGKAGGFRLGRAAARITLLEIVSPFDDISARRVCLLGRPVCSDHSACPAHYLWKTVSERNAEFFRETTVADLTTRRERS